MKALVVLALLAFMIPIGINSAFALTTYTINIPTGAASPEAPYFWASEKDGNTDGVIIVEKFDIVQWGNADTLPHTVTSGTVPSETDDRGPDGIFDSGLFYRGDYFRYQFNEVGDYPYFCLVHPWMEGVVHVVGSSTSGVQTIFGVGSDAGDGQTAFSLDYILDRNLASITVDEATKSLILTLSGNSLGDELTIMLPEDLIKNPNAVWIDDVQVTNFDSEKNGDTTTLRIPLEQVSEEVRIQGTAVVPEFGPIAIIILGIAIISMIAFSSKTQKIGILK
jgi:predicted secreted protein with PEFG-CTERM motif